MQPCWLGSSARAGDRVPNRDRAPAARSCHRRRSLIRHLQAAEAQRSYLAMPAAGARTAGRRADGREHQRTLGRLPGRGRWLDQHQGRHRGRDRHRVLAKHYLMTAGRPVDAVKELFRSLLAEGRGSRSPSRAWASPARAATWSAASSAPTWSRTRSPPRPARRPRSIPDADIIEIGGQDSKLVLKRNGVVVDYQMNKACAAGTGSFIDELAELLGVSVKNGEFARLAFAAPQTIDLGTRCAAFMGQACLGRAAGGRPAGGDHRQPGGRHGPQLPLQGGGQPASWGKRSSSPAPCSTTRPWCRVPPAAPGQDPGRGRAQGGQRRHRRRARWPAGGQLSGPQQGRAVPALVSRASRRSSPSEPRLTTFTCQACDNNCAITRMQRPASLPPTTAAAATATIRSALWRWAPSAVRRRQKGRLADGRRTSTSATACCSARSGQRQSRRARTGRGARGITARGGPRVAIPAPCWCTTMRPCSSASSMRWARGSCSPGRRTSRSSSRRSS